MDDTAKREIELEVRRLLDQQEDDLRRTMLREVEQHRAYMQTIVRIVAGVSAVLIATAGGTFAYFFGSRLSNVVDEKVVEYKIVDQYKLKLDARLDEIVNGDEISTRILGEVRQVANTEIPKRITQEVTSVILQELREVQNDDGGAVERALSNSERNTKILSNLVALLEEESELLARFEARHGIYSGMRGHGPVSEFLRARRFRLQELGSRAHRPPRKTRPQ